MKAKYKISNRILSLVLAFVMVVGLLPMTNMTVHAAVKAYDETTKIYVELVNVKCTDTDTGETWDIGGSDWAFSDYSFSKVSDGKYKFTYKAAFALGMGTVWSDTKSVTFDGIICDTDYEKTFSHSYTTTGYSYTYDILITRYGSYGHAYGAWSDNGDGTHSRICSINSTHIDTQFHDWVAATCVKAAYCKTCGLVNGEPLADAHNWGAWTSDGDGTHTRICTLNNEHTENGDCTYSDATCTALAKCSVCAGTTGELADDNHSSDSYTYEQNSSDLHNKYHACCGVFAKSEEHTFNSNGLCTLCSYQCPHPDSSYFTEGSCNSCGYHCPHLDMTDGKCQFCGLEGSIRYLARVWNSTTKTVDEEYRVAPGDAIYVTSDTTTMSDGWYIVNTDVTVSSRVTISGTVHLVLCDGATLNAASGITLNSGNELYIYAQSKDIAKMGGLTATGPKNYAGIGSERDQVAGTLVINGGIIAATGNAGGAGIGGSSNSDYHVAGGNVTINGGIVTATGGLRGAGIGGGYKGDGGNVTINGGVITATGGADGAGIGGGCYGDSGNVTINGGTIKASGYTPIGGGYWGSSSTIKDTNGNKVSLVTITLGGVQSQTAISSVEGITYGLTDVYTQDTNKLYFYLPSGAEATVITAGETVYDCKAELTYYPGHDYVDATCSLPQTCTRCGHTVGEALGHSYVDGVCTVCGIGETDGIFYISTAKQLMIFADYVNAGNQSADAVLMADIDLTGYAWTTICETGLYYNAYGTDLGYSGTFDGNGHVIKNITVKSSTTRDASCGLFGTVSGTIKNLGIEGFTFVDGGKDIRTGAIVGQLITANGKVSNCYVKNATINPGAHVTGGIAGCVYDGTIENCYVVKSTITGSSGRYGHIVGDSIGDGTSGRPGTVTNCYTDNETIRSNNVGNVTNCETKTTEAFASGEVTYLLNGSTSEGDLVWYQKDGYPQFSGSVVYYDSEKGYYSHVHNWTYTKDGNKITASCDAAGCTNDVGGSVTLKVSDAYYTDNAVEATVEGSFTNGATYVITYNDGAETAPSEVGTHTATLTVFENETEKASVSADYEISYLPAPENAYSISGGYQVGDTYWFKDGATITVKKPEGYTISTTLDGIYGESVSFSENDSKVVYLKRTSDGAMTNAITISETISFDATVPTGKITIESRGFWEKLINKITFGLFFKGDKVATVTTEDTDGSGVKSIQYYLADEDLVGDDTLADEEAIAILETAVDGNWSNYENEIALTKNAKNVIYVKITDNVGNVTYINSEGIVLYTDAEADTKSVSTIYKAGEDKDVTVKLNGNTVKSVANGTTTLTVGTDYSVSTDGVITLEATYLDTLNSGEYTFTVSYNPLGLEYAEATENDVPATTTFKVTVERADGSVTNISDISKNYDGKEVSEPTYTSLSTGKVTFEYKEKDADDSTYTTTAPSDAGDYVVRVTVAADINYNEASDTAEFTIKKATLENVSVEQDGKLTYNKAEQTATVKTSATAVNDQTVAFTYSTKENGTYSKSVPAFANAGEHTVYFTATAANHENYKGIFTVTIDKQTVTEPDIASKAYNGMTQKADIDDTDLYEVVTNNGGKAKGSYDVVLKLKDADNYKWATDTTGESATVTLQFVISAAENSWNNKPAIDGWTYGQSANAPTYEAKFGNDTVKVTYKGTANDGTTWNSEDAPAKAGTYKAIFTVDATGDYGSLSEEVRFTITKAPVTVTADDAAKTYGDSDPTAFTWQVTKGNLIGSDALDVNISREAGEKADTYAIKVSQDENANSNYDITFVNGTFTIKKAELTVTAEDKTATYGDAAPNYTVEITGWKNGDNEDVLGGKLKFTCGYAQFSDKGSYTIKAEGYQADNYTFKYVDGTLTVDAKPITVTITNKSSVYGDSIATLTADDKGEDGKGGIVNNDTNVYKLTTTASKTADVGKYDITGETLDDNYSITFKNEKDAYEITTRKLTVTVKVANKQYDGLNTATITSATLNNVANDDAVTLVNGTATFTSVNAADGISIAFTDFVLSGEADVLKNYTLTQPTGVKANITNGWNPAVDNEYTVSAPNSNGWLKEDLVIIAGNGFELSRTNTADGTWSNTLDGTKEGADSTEQFYIRNTNTGAISELVTVNYKLDKNTESTTTTGKVSFDERNGWESFLNTISFGLFYKDEVTVKVEATDKLSEVESIEYYAVESASATALTLEQVQALADDAWTTMPEAGVGVTVEDAKQFVYYIRITDKAENVTYLSTDGAEYDTTLPAISGVEDGKTYYTTQVVTIEDKNLESVVLKSGDADAETVTLDNGKLTLAGDVDTTYTITVTDEAGNVAIVVATMKEIASVKETIKDITEDEVTSADKDTVQNVIDHVDELLKDDDLTEDEKKALEDIKTEAEKLIDKVEETDAADETEDINKVKDITSENVTTDDKEDLEKAKEDLEKALEDYKENLTEDEKKAIQDEIDRIDDALDIIEKVESVEEQIDKLPNNITKDDADEVDAAKKAYDGLSDYEKTLIDPNTKKKLDAALKAVEELKSPQTGEIPDTGDNTNFMALFMMMFGSMAAFFGILLGTKKKKEEE